MHNLIYMNAQSHICCVAIKTISNILLPLHFFLSCFNQLISTVHVSVFQGLFVWFLLSKLRRPFRQGGFFYCVFPEYNHTQRNQEVKQQKVTKNQNKICDMLTQHLWKLMHSSPSLCGWVCPLPKHLSQPFQPLCTLFINMGHGWTLGKLVGLLCTVPEESAPPKHKEMPLHLLGHYLVTGNNLRQKLASRHTSFCERHSTGN